MAFVGYLHIKVLGSGFGRGVRGRWLRQSSNLRRNSKAFDRMEEIVDKLGKECPWTKSQSSDSIIKHIREEVEEVEDEIERNEELSLIEEELGDVVFNILLLSEVLQKESKGGFKLERGILKTADKVMRRSPHVFGQEKATTVQEAMDLWQREKKREKGMLP
eukprot:CAMPEP_0113967226 /NCGR_PEP_ID=MMETSP0011_2-20120614/8799_1 /TAXON_ID=101924 /ORGANISM="Rhodosorus marinus" /LENGTH=161 /DNA_ID=CAMNT_0000980059 /DNA_START=243 /DNA_END=728 /DNA_ORIENTATION=- /assembly_acc=CAM_ASM_000156